MPSRPIDLHTHSSVSDGTETPAELVAAAVRAGLGTVALTDHDSTAGWSEATRAVAGTGLTLVPGMELSTRLGLDSVHMLAYLFDPTDPALVAETARLRDSRLHRAERIVERIAAEGIQVLTEVDIQHVSYAEGRFSVRLADQTVEAEKLLVAAGRKPNFDDLGLETVGLDPLTCCR